MIFTIPNILTMTRVAVIPVLVALFFLQTANGQWIACGLFIFSAITDFLDGFLARSLGQTTAFGTFLDPVADKLLVASALLMMVAFGQIAGAVVIPAIIILCREILVSGLREYLSSFAVSLPVSNLAKWKTTLQMAAICVLIVGDFAHPLIPDLIPVRLIGEVGLWAAAIVTIITGLEYLRIGLRHMDQKNTS